MLILAPMPLDAAVARLESKTPVASALSSAEWERMSLGLKERAFFMSRVESLRVVAEAQNKIRDALAMTDAGRMNRANFVSDMRQLLGAAPGDSGELTDITSNRRLSLVYEHNVADVREYAGWKAGQDPDLLDEFPAQELVRHEDREEPRDWALRWARAGGDFYAGRMIALKSDPVWEKISRFGKPWPPFDFGSGMGVEDIDRDEAESLGLIKPGERPRPIEADFNAKLEASVSNATPEMLASLQGMFGDQVGILAGEGSETKRIVWNSGALGRFYDEAVAGAFTRETLDLGVATPETVSVFARDLGVDATGWRYLVRQEDISHPVERHGIPGLLFPGSGEKYLGKQVPLTKEDFLALPSVWRSPDRVIPKEQGGKSKPPPPGWPGSILIESRIGNFLYVANYYIDPDNKAIGPVTAYKTYQPKK
jgi:hypothetical protein